MIKMVLPRWFWCHRCRLVELHWVMNTRKRVSNPLHKHPITGEWCHSKSMRAFAMTADLEALHTFGGPRPVAEAILHKREGAR